MANDLAEDTQIVLCTASGMMYPVEDVLSAAVGTTHVLSATSVYVLCAALNGCELSVCAGTILFKPHVLSIQNTMVRTYVHLLSGWMCALCFMYAYVLFVHYMVCSLLLSICMYTACFLYVRTRGVYVLCMQYVLYSIIMYVLSEYAL